MIVPEHQDENEAAYWRLKPTIDQQYPRGHFVAIADGKVVGDAASFEEIHSALLAAGRGPKDAIVVQAGDEIPPFAYIL